ncbi:MAG: hypothetical protein ACI88C_000028 [Acidimicrobiales bacterium]|jgi:hypothetical protein
MTKLATTRRLARNSSRPIQVSGWLTLLVLCTVCAVSMMSCVTSRDLLLMEEMSEPEFDRFTGRLSVQIAVIATAAVEAGDITTEALQSTANDITGALDGGASFALGHLELEWSNSVAMQLVFMEVDAAIDQAGAYTRDGTLSGRGVEALRAVAAALLSVGSGE